MRTRLSRFVRPALAVSLLVVSGCDDAPQSPMTPAGTAGTTAGTTGSVQTAGTPGVAGGSAGSSGAASPQGGGSGGAKAGAGAGAGSGGVPSAGSVGSQGGAGAAAGSGGGSGAGQGGSAGGGNAGAAGATVGPECEGDDQVDFGLVGWAAQNGGTRGGKGGTTMRVSDGAALVAALKAQQDSSTGLTLLVSGKITTANAGVEKIEVKDVRNVSIIGEGAGAEFDGIGIKIVRAGNIVIRNLRIHHVASGDKDAISIEGPADHIWIDHNELYNQYQGVDKDFYDGLLDAKAETEYVTYSWNYLHDSWKAALVGSSEDDTFDRKLTMHHNFFKNVNSRLPLFRGGNGHVFNNYYLDVVDTAVNSRIGGCLRIEANYFSNVRNPWVSAYSDELGGGELKCNAVANGSVFEYADDVKELPTCTAQVPYNYDAVLNGVEHVPAVVMENAGVGKLDDPTAF